MEVYCQAHIPLLQGTHNVTICLDPLIGFRIEIRIKNVETLPLDLFLFLFIYLYFKGMLCRFELTCIINLSLFISYLS